MDEDAKRVFENKINGLNQYPQSQNFLRLLQRYELDASEYGEDFLKKANLIRNSLAHSGKLKSEDAWEFILKVRDIVNTIVLIEIGYRGEILQYWRDLTADETS